jgi:hypothetical protein
MHLYVPLKHAEALPVQLIQAFSGFINQRGDILYPTRYWEEDVVNATIRANDGFTFMFSTETI